MANFLCIFVLRMHFTNVLRTICYISVVTLNMSSSENKGFIILLFLLHRESGSRLLLSIAKAF